MIKRTFFAALLLALALPASAQVPKKVDRAKSSIRFVTTQMNVPVEGQFKRFDATVAFDPAAPCATFSDDVGALHAANRAAVARIARINVKDSGPRA